MTAIFLSLFNMSITASIAAFAVMLMRIPLKKAPKIFSYALWSVVIFRLIFPFSIESIFSLMPAYENMLPQAITLVQNPIPRAYTQEIAQSPAPMLIRTGNTINITAMDVVAYIWLIGVVLLLGYAIKGYLDLQRRVRFATLIYDNIYESDRIKTPFVLGFFCPKIYFPTAIDPFRHDYILKHEQIHIARRDYIIKPLSYIVFAMHWFNPIMWVAYFLMSKDMEMSCDEAVLRKMDEDIRRDYSMLLLSLAVKQVSLLNPIAFASGESNVKERVSNVLGYKKCARLVTAGLILVVGSFMVGFSSDSILSVPQPDFELQVEDWQLDDHGALTAPPHIAQGVATDVFHRYFSAFSNDWQNFGTFHLAAYPGTFDYQGNLLAAIGRGYTYANEHRDFIPPFIYFVCSETEVMRQIVYSPPLDNFITHDIAPFEITLAEAHAIYGSDWFGWGLDTSLPITKSDEYVNMLNDFSRRLVLDMGFARRAITDMRISAGANFANGFVNTNVYVDLDCGTHITISYRIYDMHFVISGIALHWRID